MAAAIGLFVAGCGDGQTAEEPITDDQAASDTASDEGSEDPDVAGATPEGGADVEDPNDDVQDGVYRGNGVALPVPDGWSINPVAFQQGLLVATPEDGAQQLTAQAIDTAQAGADAGPLDLESLLAGIRQQVDRDAEADEEVDVVGAEQAHRLTYLQLPAQQEGQPETSATIMIADGGDGLVGEFVYSAAAEDYDENIASLLVEQAGFDPDSEPVELPQAPQPSTDSGGGDTEERSDGAG